MTTPGPGNPITMGDINTELDFITPASNLELKNDFYSSAANSYPGNALMYHNLNMASNGTTSAKNAIYDPYNSNQNMTMSNWYNYSRDVDMVTTFTVTNNSANGVIMDVQIWDSADTPVGMVFNGNLAGGGGSSSGTATGPLTISTIGSGGYRIAIQTVTFSPPPPPGITYTVNFSVSASDTDGVGAGTTRTTYNPSSYSETGGSPPSPFTAVKVVDTSGNTIYTNKRTTVTITLS